MRGLGIVSGPGHRMYGVTGVLAPAALALLAAVQHLGGRASCADERRRNKY